MCHMLQNMVQERIGSMDGDFKGRCEKVQWIQILKDAANRFSGWRFQRTLRIGSVYVGFKERCGYVQWMRVSKDAADMFSGCRFQRTHFLK